MRYMNKTMLKGRVGSPPELRKLPSGDSVVHFSVATRVGKHVEWHRCTAFDVTAEEVKSTFGKGYFVYVEGEHRTREISSESGRPRKIFELVVKEHSVLEKRHVEDEEVEPDENPLEEAESMPNPQSDAFVKAKPNKRSRARYF